MLNLICVMANRRLRVAATLSLVLVAACASQESYESYDSPYAVVEPGSPSAARRELPVFIHDVDGQIPVSQRYGIPVPPGKHSVVVNFSSDSIEGSADKHSRTVQLDAEPCTRYRIVARHTQLTHVDWEPVVYSERIGECTKRFARGS
jgi:hypothetical protein